jgi:hypothetical protein
MRIGSPSLTLLAFAPMAAEGRNAISAMWDTLGGLGAEGPVPGLGVGIALPDELPPDDVWFRLVAAKASTGGDGPSATAAAFVAHDVLGAMVRTTAPPDAGEDGWRVLGDASRCAIDGDPLPGLLGFADVFAGAVDAPVEAAMPALGSLARQTLDAHVGDGLDLCAAVLPGVALWERETAGRRTFAMVAGSEAPDVVQAWPWLAPGEDDLGQLARYLLHASKLRFEIGVFRADVTEMRAQERALDQTLDELFALHERFEQGEPVAAQLVDAQSRLSRAHSQSAGLVVAMTRLRDLQETATIAANNFAAHEPAPMPGVVSERAAQSPFDRDRSLAAWLERQVTHDVAYFDSCRERAAEAQALTSLRLQQASEEHARMANWLSVLQTSILGALLGALGVASTLGHAFDVSSSMRAAMMTLVASMALFLPALAVRWPHGYGPIELAAFGVVGAAAGWVAVAAASGDASAWLTLLVAALGAAVAVVAAARANGRRR